MQRTPKVDQTRVVWHRDMASLEKILAPHVVQIDGQQFVTPDAPIRERNLYGQLTQLGYAKGWM